MCWCCIGRKNTIFARVVLHVNKLNVASVCCREPRGIGFLEYTNPRDAEDAIYGLDRKIIDGKEVGASTCKA